MFSAVDVIQVVHRIFDDAVTNFTVVARWSILEKFVSTLRRASDFTFPPSVMETTLVLLTFESRSTL